MLYHYFFLALFVFSLSAQEPVQTRTFMGENWKIISRGSIGTGVIGYTITASGNYTLSESITPLSGNTNTIIQI